MSFLVAADRKEIQAVFDRLKDPVKLSLFTRMDSVSGQDTHALLNELEGLTDKIQLEVLQAPAAERVPALTVSSQTTRGLVRFFGSPIGYEFPNLLASVLDASRGEIDLGPSANQVIVSINRPVHIQVFVTPTCPYCGPVARLAHQIAFANPHVTADAIEINEFEDLARRYRIQGVPKTVINDSVEFVGAVPEKQFLEYLQSVI